MPSGFYSLTRKVSYMKRELTVKLSCAVLLIVSSIALASYQTVYEKDIAGGVLMYIAQAFLLAGSIFGLDYYVHRLTQHHDKVTSTHTEQG